MKLSSESSRAFSQSLLRIHAATDAGVLALVEREEQARHAASDWAVRQLEEHVRQRAGQLQGMAAPARADELTPRERQVLARIARGDTDAAAGRALGVATRTVSKHVENILRKLGVETRTAAVQAGLR
jgi:DNA-binding NarL/FixJ family response regulator